jgi:hypothetical protein
MQAIDEALTVSELVSQGGAWSGLLFDNPTAGLPPQLTWTFTFDFKEVERSFGTSRVGVSVDWVPLEDSSRHAMAGQTASATTFAQPIESTVYFFEHHRFDAVSLQVLEQHGNELLVQADLRGDLDGLGIEALTVSASLEFEAIVVHLSEGPPSVPAARARLASFADTAGLDGEKTTRGFRFVPTSN